ncbi:sorting nexin-32-like isoform X1 [Oratosquilla oratoria]|uniref:sorting nexin-32-like isoform X1 n=2 Tax=Oratosquilla oratoria TaxID=337810 RepID=UPI003F76CA28
MKITTQESGLYTESAKRMLEEGSGSGASSNGSTPEPPEPFAPNFTVRFTDRVNKDGDSVRFTLQVCQNGLTIQLLEREFEDFEYLEHCVVTNRASQGIIIPPLPQRSAIDPHTAEVQSRQQMGKDSRKLIADEFHKDCRQLQKYIELLLSHPVLGKDEKLDSFLTNKDPPPRTKVKKSLLSRLSDSLDARKAAYPDSEEFFQKERDWVAKYRPAVVESREAFNKIIYAELRIVHQLEEISTALKLSSCPSDQVHHKRFNMVNYLFADFVDTIKNHVDDSANKDDSSLGFMLTLWSHYIESEETMLLGRTCLMVDYQQCNRALDKAKPNRKEVAEKAKKEAEAAFEDCSDVARHEIKRFQRLRSNEMMAAIDEYASLQLASARNTLAAIGKSLDQIKSMSF